MELIDGKEYLYKSKYGDVCSVLDGWYLRGWYENVPDDFEFIFPIDHFMKLQSENDKLINAAQSLINQLPDCTIDWARNGIGNTNAAAIIKARDELKEALASNTNEDVK